MFFSLTFPQFPAQVIESRDRTFHGRAFVVVRQMPGSHKSSVIACSPEAVRLGVGPGMPMHIVERMNKKIETVMHDPALDALVVEELRNIGERYTPVFTVNDRGECLLDMAGTPSLRTTTLKVAAAAIKNDIGTITGLQGCAMGISRSMIVARILARHAGPGNVEFCPAGDEARVLALLETKHLPGLSPTIREKLKRYGITNVSQLQKLPRDALAGHFGSEGEKLFCLSRGLEPGMAATAGDYGKMAQEISVETVFDHDIVDRNCLRERVWYTVDRLCNELKHNNAATSKILMIINYGDGKAHQRTMAFASPTNDFIAIRDRIAVAFFELYQRRVSIRSLQLCVKHISAQTGQLDLFETAWQRKQGALSEGIMRVREKFNFDAVLSAGNITT